MLDGSAAVNPNGSWLNSRGIWLTYCLGILLLHLLILSFPFLSVAWAWSLTNLTHNVAMFFFLHTLKGVPWESADQGKSRYLTQWEQIDDEMQFTATRKFLTVVPVFLFFLTSFYTKYDSVHFAINFCSLMFVLIPKLPQFHKVRLFGINKYWKQAEKQRLGDVSVVDICPTSFFHILSFFFIVNITKAALPCLLL